MGVVWGVVLDEVLAVEAGAFLIVGGGGEKRKEGWVLGYGAFFWELLFWFFGF